MTILHGKKNLASGAIYPASGLKIVVDICIYFCVVIMV